MSRFSGGASFLVPRRTIRFVVALVAGTAGAALTLVVHVHRTALPEDLLLLEIAAGLLVVTVLSAALVPLRLRRLHRTLQRTLEDLESGTLSAVENPLGSLGVAFQEHYRHLWRSNILHRGAIEVHRSLVQNLVALLDVGCIVLDGKGTVNYRSEAAAALGDDGEALDVAVTPPISEIISVLAAGEQIEDVSVGGATYYCYPVFGPVLLRRNTEGGPLLEPRQGLAFVLLTDRPLKRADSTNSTASHGKGEVKQGVLFSIESLFLRGKKRR